VYTHPPEIRKLSNPSWLDEQDQKGGHHRSLIENHFKLVTRVIKKVYAQAEANEPFSHRNWFRTLSTLNGIRSELEGFSDFTSQLGEQYKFSKAK
jgi:hypothetical protein